MLPRARADRSAGGRVESAGRRPRALARPPLGRAAGRGRTDRDASPEIVPGNEVDSVFGVRLRCRVRAGPAGRRQEGPVVRQEESLVIEVQHLTKQYGRFTAVDDVTFRVDKG